ncbi:FkbM family methyltransferase [Nonomuraea diastatica]|uniref:FkbM family methyltransferase n=1 Tax=Nonomuraea diastatica TaxID=1848329 RepID=A0A4R4VA49_9ACTN|nr:FkbM family methyltransferase [Nonomuraea diastatica]TDD01962.1 FkbM family methyltransferase [Nonomuraea diastatica]
MTSSKRLRKKAAITVMRAARAANRSKITRILLRGRSVRRLPLVNRLYHTVFRLGVTTSDHDAEARYRGVVLTGPTWDATIMPSVSAGYYEEFEVTLFERLAAASRTILDIGANIGVYACTGAAHLPPDGTLIAFEPVPENIGYLRRNVDRNDLTARVTIEPVAVGAAPGDLTVHLSGEQSGKHSAAAANVGTPTGTVTIPMTSIDAYLARHGLAPPDIIKIDVEGYEGFVLHGAADTLTAQPTLLFELHPQLQANCGCSAGELLDLVFARYPWVFLIDELDKVLRPATRAGLDAPGTIGLYRSNLVAIGRRHHLDALRPWHTTP